MYELSWWLITYDSILTIARRSATNTSKLSSEGFFFSFFARIYSLTEIEERDFDALVSYQIFQGKKFKIAPLLSEIIEHI